AVEESIVAELLLQHLDRRHYARIRRREHLVHRYRQSRGIEVLVTERLGESPDLLVVAELEHLALDRVARSPDGHPAGLAHAQRWIESQRPVEPDPEHHLRVKVTARPQASLPDAGILQLPVLEDVVHDAEQDRASRL